MFDLEYIAKQYGFKVSTNFDSDRGYIDENSSLGFTVIESDDGIFKWTDETDTYDEFFEKLKRYFVDFGKHLEL